MGVHQRHGAARKFLVAAGAAGGGMAQSKNIIGAGGISDQQS